MKHVHTIDCKGRTLVTLTMPLTSDHSRLISRPRAGALMAHAEASTASYTSSFVSHTRAFSFRPCLWRRLNGLVNGFPSTAPRR